MAPLAGVLYLAVGAVVRCRERPSAVAAVAARDEFLGGAVRAWCTGIEGCECAGFARRQQAVCRLRAQIVGVRGAGFVGGQEISDDNCVIAASGDALIVEVLDVLDGPVTGDPDGVEAPPGSQRVLPPAGAVGDGKGPEWAVRKRRGPSRVVGKPAP